MNSSKKINKLKSMVIYALLLTAVLAAPAVAAETKNHCHDEATWSNWHKLLADNPDDDELYGLYAMRRGLCGMVEAGTIDIDRATYIFESARKALLAQWTEEDRERRPRM